MGPWLSQLVAFGVAVQRRGGTISHSDTQGQRFSPPARRTGLAGLLGGLFAEASKPAAGDAFRGSPPLSVAQIDAVAKQLRGTLSPSMQRMLKEFGTRGFYSWSLPKSHSLPQELTPCTWGGAEWYFDDGITAERTRVEWVNAVYNNLDDPYDQLWQSTIGLFAVADGDVWAIDPSAPGGERVVYLDHEGGDGHGTKLAENLTVLMDNWTRIGCVGPELWLLEPFLHPTKGIDGFGPNARRFRQSIGLAP